MNTNALIALTEGPMLPSRFVARTLDFFFLHGVWLLLLAVLAFVALPRLRQHLSLAGDELPDWPEEYRGD